MYNILYLFIRNFGSSRVTGAHSVAPFAFPPALQKGEARGVRLSQPVRPVAHLTVRRLQRWPEGMSEETANRREVSSGDSSCVGGSWTHRGVCRPRRANRPLQAFRAQPKRGAAAPRLPTDARCSRTSSSKSTFQGGGKHDQLCWRGPRLRTCVAVKRQPLNNTTTSSTYYIRIYTPIYTSCININYMLPHPPSVKSTR